MIVRNRIFSVAAAFAFAGLVGCGSGADQEFETTDQEIITEPGTEQVEIEIPTEDTMLVEREVETEIDVDVDTTEIEGDEVPATATPR
ncbi:MAG: hypothetical protein WD766_03965 [Gemmatimonadota bacterium]